MLRRLSLIPILAFIVGAAVVGAEPAGASPGNQISIGSTTIIEGNGLKARTANVPVTLSEPATSPVSVTVSFGVPGEGNATGGSTQLPGVDYKNTPASKTIIFKPSASTGLTPVVKYLNVKVFPDANVEGNELILVQLSNPSVGHSLNQSSGFVTIANDDFGEPGAPNFSAGDVSVVEGDAGKITVKVPVTLSDPLAEAVLVDYTVTGLSATCAKVVGTPPPGIDCNDFGGVTKTIKFPVTASGVTAGVKYVNVALYGDLVDEVSCCEYSAEALAVTLSNPRPATVGSELFVTLGTSTAVVFIVDDDFSAPS